MAFSNLTLTRYSCRDYQNRLVEDEKIAQIIEAGRLAPSACNNHPTRVIVCDTPPLKRKPPRQRTILPRTEASLERRWSFWYALKSRLPGRANTTP